jgi:hypothetical protein
VNVAQAAQNPGLRNLIVRVLTRDPHSEARLDAQSPGLLDAMGVNRARLAAMRGDAPKATPAVVAPIEPPAPVPAPQITTTAAPEHGARRSRR